MRSILITTFISILFSNYEKDIQTMFILAEPGDTIHLGKGLFSIKGTLSMEGKENIVIAGNSIDKTILSFKGLFNHTPFWLK